MCLLYSEHNIVLTILLRNQSPHPLSSDSVEKKAGGLDSCLSKADPRVHCEKF